MSKNNDPRNMFVDNRQGYTQQDEPSGSPTATPQVVVAARKTKATTSVWKK